MGRPDLVIADVDNTLIDTRLRDYRSFADTCAEFGLPVPSWQWFVQRRMRGMSSRNIGQELARMHDGEMDLERFLSRRHARLDRPELFCLDSVIPGVLSGLAALEAAGVAVGVATLRSGAAALRAELARLGMGSFIKHVVTRDEISGSVPVPYGTDYQTLKVYKQHVLQAMLARVNVAPGRVVFVTDTAFDLDAGSCLGLKTVAVQSGYASAQELAIRADVVVAHFGQVPGVFGFTG